MMASDRGTIRRVHDQPEPEWVTELSDIFAFDEPSGWVLDPARRLRWGAHPGLGTTRTRRVTSGRC
jgi:hypothetical protein